MNDSGKALESMQELFGLSLEVIQEHLVVFTDNMDTKLGKAKFKVEGSALGHNGIKSISKFFGDSLSFKRVLLGISRPDNKDFESVANHVMGEFNLAETRSLIKESYPLVDRMLN